MHRLDSIRSKLIVWILTPSLLLWIGSSYWIYRTISASAVSTYDYNLITFLETVSNRIRMVDGQPRFDFPLEVIPVMREHHIDSRYFQVLGPNRAVVAGEPSLPQPPDYQFEPQLFYGSYKGEATRVASLKVAVGGADQNVYVQIVETMTGRKQVGRQALHSLVVVGLLLAVLLISTTLFAMRRILSPLDRIREQLLDRSIEMIDDLKEENAPTEVRPLVSAINSLMSRARLDLDRQKRFVRNAAHQLRTPLSGLKLQTELALRDENVQSLSPALGQIRRSIDQTSNLVGKLLSLATSEQPPDRSKMQKCDLNQIIRAVAAQLAPLAVKKNIDLGVDGPNTAQFVKAEEWGLRELAVNILENAIQYTSAGGAVTARVNCSADAICLEVVDNGCGMPPEERERAFEPFYRLPNSPVGGSGLGLAIVRELAGRYNATVIIETPADHPGTLVIVKFKVD